MPPSRRRFVCFPGVFMSRGRVFLTGYMVTFAVVFRSEAVCLCRIIMVLCCFIVCFFRHDCSPLYWTPPPVAPSLE